MHHKMWGHREKKYTELDNPTSAQIEEWVGSWRDNEVNCVHMQTKFGRLTIWGGDEGRYVIFCERLGKLVGTEYTVEDGLIGLHVTEQQIDDMPLYLTVNKSTALKVAIALMVVGQDPKEFTWIDYVG